MVGIERFHGFLNSVLCSSSQDRIVKCNTRESKERINEGESRHYVFSTADIRTGIDRFLKQAGYYSKPKKSVGLVEPDFRARRRSGGSTFEIAGIVPENIDQRVEALNKLPAARAANRNGDFALVLPPIRAVNNRGYVPTKAEVRPTWMVETRGGGWQHVRLASIGGND